MTDIAILIDVGSTWTKGITVSLPDGHLVARHQHPTTLAEGIMHGVEAVVAELEAGAGGRVAFRAASSSAAGGLRVAAIGLVPSLTGLAARQASLGAGARVVFTGSYQLTADDIERMRAQRPDILLLSGGTDGGDTKFVRANAAILAQARIDAAAVVACNRAVRDEVAGILAEAGYQVHPAENVLPALDEVNAASAQQAIRAVFLERIVVARGIEHLRDWAADGLMPTPRAVLEATGFLADGPLGLRTVVVVDVGGATTDVHSVGGNEPVPGVPLKGLPEPRLKRTVEGDLGLRVSAEAAVHALGTERLAAALDVTHEALQAEAARRAAETRIVQPDDDFDRVLTAAVVAEALNRHAGHLEPLPIGKNRWVQVGKDLRGADALLCSGGVFAARADAPALAAAALEQAAACGRLVPASPRVLIDRNYCLYAVGLLAARQPAAAARLAARAAALEPA